MAGLTSTFHLPCGSHHLLKPRHSPSFQLRAVSFRLRSPASISTAVYARYGGGGAPGRSRSGEDEALDMSLIRSDTVRLIDEQQKMVGIVSKAQALQMADDVELDLVILSPDAEPPVVRIMDYSYNIDAHDYSVRLKAAQKFLKDGDKVKVIVNLKGRENEFRSNAIELIRRFQNDLGELAIEESKNLRDKNIFIVLIPNKAVVQKSQDPSKKKENSEANEVSARV